MSERATRPSPAPADVRVDGIGVICSDLVRTVVFYRAAGVNLPDPPGSGHIDADLGNGVRVMFDTEEVMRSFSARDTWTGSAGRLTLAVRCPTPAEVDRMHDLLVPLGQGSLNPPFDAFWGQRYATVLDPDRTRVDLYADAEPATP